jgi:hypothetical protein
MTVFRVCVLIVHGVYNRQERQGFFVPWRSSEYPILAPQQGSCTLEQINFKNLHEIPLKKTKDISFLRCVQAEAA